MASPIRSPRRRQVGLREYFLVDGRFSASPNNWLPPSPSVTPDESIIRQRGRKSLSTPVTATRTSPRKSPRKSVSIDLTQSTTTTTLDTSIDESPVVEKDTETPGRTNSTLRAIRKRLVLSNKDLEDDTDDPDYTASLMSPPKKKREKKTVKKGSGNELEDKLKALNHQQIVDVIIKITANNTDLQQEFLQSLPEPDISPLIKNLECLRRNIIKSLPYTKYGSDRDAFCFRRVKTHVASFKAAIVSDGKQFTEAISWNTALQYVQQAWDEVEQLPDWDNESHCKTKQGCFRSLAALCKQAIRGSSLDKQKYIDFKEWLVEVSDLHPEMKPCIAMVEKKLKK